MNRRVLALAPWLLVPVALLWPALWNGFAILYPDSMIYLGNFRWPSTPPWYTAFVVFSSLRTDLWLTLALQCGLAIAVLAAFLVVIGRLRLRQCAPALLVLAAVTQLPWLVSWIMPDFLAGLGILAVILLALQNDLSRPLILFLAAMACLAGLVASANGILLGGLLVFCLILRRWSGGRLSFLPVLAAGLAITASLALAAGLNFRQFGHFELNSGGPAMMFTRLVDSHVADPVLERECATASHPVCAYLPLLQAAEPGKQSFLWEGPANATDAMASGREDYARLNSLILHEHWQQFLAAGASDSWKLLLTPALNGGWLDEIAAAPAEPWARAGIARHFAHLLPAHEASRDYRGTLRAAFWDHWYIALAWLGYASLALAGAICARRGDRTGGAVAAALFAVIAAEIVLHAMLVGPFPRYHAKVSWLAWAGTLALLARLRRKPLTVPIAEPSGGA